MAGNFGIGLGSFLSGAVEGANAYSTIQTNRSRQKLNDIKVKEAESDFAQKRANQDIQAEVDRIGKIGLEAATVEHGDDVKKVLNHYYTNTIPQQQQRLIQSGKVDAAETLGKFMETKQAKQLTETSALAIKQATMGDYTNLGPTIEGLLNTSSAVTGGGAYKLKGMTELTDDKGQKTGGVSFAVTDSNGKEQSISFGSSGELIGFIRNNAMPDKIVEYAYDQEEQAKKVRAETAKNQQSWNQKIAEKGLDFKYDLAKAENNSQLNIAEQRVKSGLTMQEQANKAQLENAYGTGDSGGSKKVAEAEATIAFLKKNGVPDDYIQQNISAIVGLENKTRPMSSRIDDYVKMRSGADMRFAQLEPTEQIKQAREYIGAVDSQNTGAGEGASVPNPFGGGAAQTAGKGLTPFFDSKTNSIVYK